MILKSCSSQDRWEESTTLQCLYPSGDGWRRQLIGGMLTLKPKYYILRVKRRIKKETLDRFPEKETATTEIHRSFWEPRYRMKHSGYILFCTSDMRVSVSVQHDVCWSKLAQPGMCTERLWVASSSVSSHIPYLVLWPVGVMCRELAQEPTTCRSYAFLL